MSLLILVLKSLSDLKKNLYTHSFLAIIKTLLRHIIFVFYFKNFTWLVKKCCRLSVENKFMPQAFFYFEISTIFWRKVESAENLSSSIVAKPAETVPIFPSRIGPLRPERCNKWIHSDVNKCGNLLYEGIMNFFLEKSPCYVPSSLQFIIST